MNSDYQEEEINAFWTFGSTPAGKILDKMKVGAVQDNTVIH